MPPRCAAPRRAAEPPSRRAVRSAHHAVCTPRLEMVMRWHRGPRRRRQRTAAVPRDWRRDGAARARLARAAARRPRARARMFVLALSRRGEEDGKEEGKGRSPPAANVADAASRRRRRRCGGGRRRGAAARRGVLP